jgi:hypothetical protein
MRLFFALLLGLCTTALLAQKLPVRSVTLFKNGKALIQKSGTVRAENRRFSARELPQAQYGTLWFAAENDALAAVFSCLDSVDNTQVIRDQGALLEANLGKQVALHLSHGIQGHTELLRGSIEKVEYSEGFMPRYHLKTRENSWVTVESASISHIEFAEQPSLNYPARKLGKKPQPRIEVVFNNDRPEQALSMFYLRDQIGWTPIYSLVLPESGKARLALRAKLANDAEDLGDAELRLAVGNPNFPYAQRLDWLVQFEGLWGGQAPSYGRPMPVQYSAMQMANDAGYAFMGGVDEGDAALNFEGAQAEDFYFYTIRPGNFPKNSRYQYPIFETELDPKHYYQCQLPEAGPNAMLRDMRSTPNMPGMPKFPVSHYVSFSNPTSYPFTTGAVNILSQSGDKLYPISQDRLGYTPPKAQCAVKVAETPEIKVTHAEGDVERKASALRFFNRSYSATTVEAQVCAVNFKKEAVTLKVQRTIQGNPLRSDIPWGKKQEEATLSANASHVVEWEISLKPGEEKKWTYRYEVFMEE